MSISKTPRGTYSHQPKIDYSQVNCPHCGLQSQHIALLSCFTPPQYTSPDEWIKKMWYIHTYLRESIESLPLYPHFLNWFVRYRLPVFALT
uniref:Uncharacterized protein n=1 Tax=Prolemur simus TaxID=1328070 RepID=A0A8C8YVK0_PROSS